MYRRSCRSISLMCLTVYGWSIHAETERPRVKKADVGISHQTQDEKDNFVYVPGTYIYIYVVALAAGVQRLCVFPACIPS